jgi:hypothetical protein
MKLTIIEVARFIKLNEQGSFTCFPAIIEFDGVKFDSETPSSVEDEQQINGAINLLQLHVDSADEHLHFDLT